MTKSELLALIEAEALKTSITPTEFVRRLRADPNYEYESAHWFKVMVAADRLKRLMQEPPPPAPGVDLEPARNLLVWATVTESALLQACQLPPRWKFLFTADPAYRFPREWVAVVKASGHHAYAWCDCHTTLPVACRTFAQEYGLEDWYGEAESAAAFDTAYNAGAPAVVGNLSALTAAQLSLVGQAKILFAHELYLNVHPWEKPDWRNANAGVGGNCGAVYGSASEGADYTPVSSQPAEWFHPYGSWYVEAFRAADWETLRVRG
jgi:hypothetical protein